MQIYDSMSGIMARAQHFMLSATADLYIKNSNSIEINEDHKAITRI